MPYTTKQRYKELERHRKKFETIAIDCSKLTVPTLFPEMSTPSGGYDEPMDGFGARGVNNLASKLTLTLFPPTQSFFKLTIPNQVRQELEQAQVKDVLIQVENILSVAEQRMLTALSDMASTANVFSLIRQLIVTGNGMLWLERNDSEMTMTVLTLRHYVVRRGNDGKVLELIIRIARDTDESGNLPEFIEPLDGPADFTHIEYKEGGTYTVYQGDGDSMEFIAEYDENEVPFVVPRWNMLPGESYSVGLCGEHIGDLRSLEGLTHALAQISATTARQVYLVNPSSFTRAEDLQDAECGDFIPGRADDVTLLVNGNPSDFGITLQLREAIVTNLSHVFLLNSVVQRNAERVTAEEIRFMAAELESALGGVYSLLADTLVLPLLRWLASQLKELGVLPKFPKGAGDIVITIVTGFNVLSRNNDFMKLQGVLGTVMQLLGPQALTFFKPRNLVMKLASSQGLDVADLLKTDEELQQEQQQQQALMGAQAAIQQGGRGGQE